MAAESVSFASYVFWMAIGASGVGLYFWIDGAKRGTGVAVTLVGAFCALLTVSDVNVWAAGKHIANIVGPSIFVFAVGLVLYDISLKKQLIGSARREAHVRTPPMGYVKFIAPPPSEETTAPAGTATTQVERVFVHLSATQLAGLIEPSLTGVQSKRLIEPYLHKWIRLSISIKEVASHGHGEYFDYSVYGDADGIYVFMRFKRGWHERVALLVKGVKVIVLGELDGIDRHGITLGNCEILPPD